MLVFVDDQADFLDAISRSLGSIGYHDAVFVTNAEEAWAAARSAEKIDHVICDLRMPGGGAVELLSKVRRISPTAGCTLLTAFTNDLSVEDWAALSALRVNVVGKSQISATWLSELVEGSSPEHSRLPVATKGAWGTEAAVADDRRVFDVFLSYSSKDRFQVQVLAERLRDDGIRVWFDEWELVPGRPWQEALEAMIGITKTAAVLIGRSGLGPWETPEMRACLFEFVSRSMPVIPVLLPGAAIQPMLPLFLRQFTWVDMREGCTDESIARLKWGITGEKNFK